MICHRVEGLTTTRPCGLVGLAAKGQDEPIVNQGQRDFKASLHQGISGPRLQLSVELKAFPNWQNVVALEPVPANHVE